MNLPLLGQHALVTGAGSGIGRAIAVRLSREGANITYLGRRREPLEAWSEGAGCVVTADVTDRDEVERAFRHAREAAGPITILVNNAGAAVSAPLARITAEDWRRTMAVNLDALLHCTQAALPDLLAAESGRIVTIASTAGLKGYAYSAAYVAAKHGAVGFTRALAVELAGTRVTVNAVCPGFTESDMVDEAVERIMRKTGRSEAEARSELARFNPQGRLIRPEEVADAVLWLCLPESGSITGQAIAVAGGEVM